MLKLIRKALLKSNRIKRAVFAVQDRENKQRQHDHWRLIMSGRAIRDKETEKLSELHVDYLDTRMVTQRPVAPLYINSVNWGGM